MGKVRVKAPFSYDKIMVNEEDFLVPLRDALLDGIKLGDFTKRIEGLTRCHVGDVTIKLEPDWDDMPHLSIRYKRLETDVEQRKRIDRHEKSELRKKLAPLKQQEANRKRLEELRQEVERLESTLAPTA